MSKLKENIIIHNEDNIDLESNYYDIDISHMKEKENKIYTKIKRFIKYLFDI